MTAGVLAQGRQAAESRMLSTCTVYHQAGRGTPDPTTGHAPILWTVVHEGPMRLGGIPRGASQETVITIPGGKKVVAKRTSHLPHTVAGLREGDLMHIAAGERSGTWWWLGDATGADQQTALRLSAAEAEKPEDL